jgi:hypothetical protein
MACNRETALNEKRFPAQSMADVCCREQAERLLLFSELSKQSISRVARQHRHILPMKDWRIACRIVFRTAYARWD